MTGDGLLVVDKPAGWTSHDVVGRVRRLAGTRKVGHAGTLDPMATGVLVVGLNRATRLLGHLTLTEKEYLATVRLGEATTTDDAEGETLSTADASTLGEDIVRAAAEALTGDLEQVPSAVSAVKVQGVRSYARVRAGEQVDLQPRRVHVARFEVLSSRHAGDRVDVDVAVTCSSGTYVRALARDMGERLGVGGHLTELRRTRVGPLTLADASSLEALAEDLRVLPMPEVARRTFPVLQVTDEQAGWVRSGRRLPGVELPAAGPVALLSPDGEFLALYRQDGPDARAVAVFVG